jgi:small subunit ribosomal protein S9
MEIIARAVGRRKEAVAQVQLLRGTGKFIINTKAAHEYLQNDSCAILAVQAPFDLFKQNNLPKADTYTPEAYSSQADNSNNKEDKTSQSSLGSWPTSTSLETVDTIVKVKGGGLKGQAEAIRLGVARALCLLETSETNNQKTQQTVLSIHGPAALAEKANPGVASSDSTQQNVGLRKLLKDKGYLTQDSRVKERRKYGLKKARKASQYHKR